jgi:aminoglycoside 3-N-acetyltransferase I
MTNFSVRRIGAGEAIVMEEANRLFADVFGEEGYHGPAPSRDHLLKLLADNKFIALAAWIKDEMVGALAAYELVKYEAERSEIYIYDLAVDNRFRRRGIATALIEEVKRIARKQDAWVIFVQADSPDKPAVALYRKLGNEERVLHFDITPAFDP